MQVGAQPAWRVSEQNLVLICTEAQRMREGWCGNSRERKRVGQGGGWVALFREQGGQAGEGGVRKLGVYGTWGCESQALPDGQEGGWQFWRGSDTPAWVGQILDKTPDKRRV